MVMSHGAPQHGSSSRFVTAGLIVALGVNLALGAGMVVATHMKSDAIAAEAGLGAASQEATFNCRWMAQGRFHQIEVKAKTWQAAEAQACGTQFRDVRLPPLVSRGYGAMIGDPDRDPFLLAQRESCSCSEGQMPPPLLQDVLIEAPKLGTQEKQQALPRIENNPEEVERNVVAPDIKPVPRKEEPKPPEEPKKEEPKPKKKVHEPNLDELLKRSENFDEARPANQDAETGVEWGSKNSKGPGAGDLYLQKLKARLDNSMQAPSSIPRTELSGLKAQITIRIGANGKIWGWSWRSKSGNDAFDAMIERTVKRYEVGGDASFPDPPQEWLLKDIPIKVDGSSIK